MSEQKSDVLVRFGSDIGPLKKGTKTASREMAKFGKQVAANTKQVGLFSAAIAVASAAVGVKFVKDSFSAIDAQAKLARQLGTSVKSITNLELAASLSGMSLDQVATASKALEVRLAEAADGTGQAVSALKDLGLSAESLIDLDLDEKISLINTAIKENIEPTKQAAIAADFFGSRAGAAMLTLSSDVIKTASDEVERLGMAMTDVDAAKIESANDAIDLLSRSVDGVVNQFSVAIAPAVKAAADAISEEFATASGDMSKGVERAADAAIEAFAKVLDGGASVIEFIEANPDVAKFGLMGYMIFGKKGALIGATIAATINTVLDPLKQMGLVGTESTEAVNSEIEILEGKLGNVQRAINLLDWTGISPEDAAYADLIEKATLLQVEISDLKGSIQEGSAAEQELNRLMEEGASSGDLLSESMRRVAESIREAKSAGMPDVSDQGDDDSGSDEDIDDPVAKAREVTAEMKRSWQEYYGFMADAAAESQKNQVDSQKAFGSDSVNAYSRMFGDISSLMDSESKAQFEIGKKAAQGQAIIDTIASAQAAYKSLAGIPVIGPSLGIAAAGTATIAGMKRLGQINSTSYGQKSVPGGAGGASASSAADTSTQTQSAGAAQNKTLTLEGFDPSMLYRGDQLSGLLDAIRDAQDGGYNLVVS